MFTDNCLPITVEKISQREILDYCIQQHLPFAIYKLPHRNMNILIVSKEAGECDFQYLMEEKKDAFCIASFCLKDKKLIGFSCDYEVSEFTDKQTFDQIKKIKPAHFITPGAGYETDYSEYQKQFDYIFSQIENKRISKAILSRIKHVPGFGSDLAVDLYYQLSETYKRAYTFLCFTPQTGMWTGASPELLFKAENGTGTTVSLAGTKNGDEDSAWGDKELDEQQIVTDFVNGVLEEYGIENAVVEGPETIQAGKMSHLRTQYHFPVDTENSRLTELICNLHPTPAVCGLPKQTSMQVINEAEKHERSFYAGFLGRIGPAGIKLFVNIRSMKFVKGGTDLYLGGGITLGSDAEKEWQETELKAGTLLNVIKEIKK